MTQKRSKAQSRTRQPNHLTVSEGRPHAQSKRRTPMSQLRYQAAEIARREGWSVPAYYDGERAHAADRMTMVRIARDMYDNNAIYQAIIDGFVNTIIGRDGVEISPTCDPDTAQTIKAEWRKFEIWADDTAREDLTGLERQIATEYFNVGEVLVIKNRARGTILIIESERIKTVITAAQSSAFGGATYSSGRYIAFEIYTDSTRAQTQIIPAQDAIYLAHTRRPSQLRGCGILWGCVDFVEMMMHILRNSAKAWDVVSHFALIIERNQEAYSTDDNDDGEIDGSEDLNNRFMELGRGIVFEGEKGENIKSIDHAGVPSVNLEQHVLIYLRIISSVIGCDAATFVLSDYSKTNYSSSKAANIALTRVVEKHQNRFRQILYRPLYMWKLGAFIVADLVQGGPELLDQCNYILPALQSIDDEKEAKTAAAQLAVGMTTHTEVLLARNKTPDDFLRERKAEILRATKEAQDIEKKSGGLVLARDILPQLCGIVAGKPAATA